jgi:hypothetical protein
VGTLPLPTTLPFVSFTNLKFNISAFHLVCHCLLFIVALLCLSQPPISPWIPTSGLFFFQTCRDTRNAVCLSSTMSLSPPKLPSLYYFYLLPCVFVCCVFKFSFSSWYFLLPFCDGGDWIQGLVLTEPHPQPSRYFVISLVISLIHCLFENVLFNFHIFVDFPAFLLIWFLVSFCYTQKWYFVWFQSI